MDNKRKPKRFKKPFNKIDSRKQEDQVVFVSKPSRPEKPADWQLQLKAISMCMSLNEGQIISNEVDKIYNGLKHRGK